MNRHFSLLLVLGVWMSAAPCWPQDLPQPPAPLAQPPAAPPSGTAGPTMPPPQAQVPNYAPPGSYVAPPGSYAAPPGTVMVMPAQPYPYAYPPGGPMVMPPAPLVLTPAPPLASYRWSVALDALFLERNSGGSTLVAYTPGDSLYSDDVGFPLAAGLRFEVSHELDTNLTLSATYWGLQQWSVSEAFIGDGYPPPVPAASPYMQLSTLLSGPNDSLGYTSSSQIDNVEFNGLVRLNMYNPYYELSWLLGVRYVYFGDQFNLTGVDTTDNVAERLACSTTNNLVGPQTGLLFVHGWDRFQWEIGLKFGLMANMYHQQISDSASGNVPAGFVPYSATNNGTSLSALFEVSVAARFRLSDNLWLRLGYQFYDITGMALAPRQLGGFGHGGNLALDGLSIGLQTTW